MTKANKKTFLVAILCFFFLSSKLYAQYKAKITNVVIENGLQGDHDLLIINYDIENNLYNERFLVNLSFWDNYLVNTIYPKKECITGSNNNNPITGGADKRIVWDLKNESFDVLHEGRFSIDLMTLTHDITKDILIKERLTEKQLALRDKMNRGKQHGIIHAWRKWKYNKMTAKITKKNNRISLEIEEQY